MLFVVFFVCKILAYWFWFQKHVGAFKTNRLVIRLQSAPTTSGKLRALVTTDNINPIQQD